MVLGYDRLPLTAIDLVDNYRELREMRGPSPIVMWIIVSNIKDYNRKTVVWMGCRWYAEGYSGYQWLPITTTPQLRNIRSLTFMYCRYFQRLEVASLFVALKWLIINKRVVLVELKLICENCINTQCL